MCSMISSTPSVAAFLIKFAQERFAFHHLALDASWVSVALHTNMRALSQLAVPWTFSLVCPAQYSQDCNGRQVIASVQMLRGLALD